MDNTSYDEETFRYNEYGYSCRIFVIQNLNYQLPIIYWYRCGSVALVAVEKSEQLMLL